jgi:hypothetical protein
MRNSPHRTVIGVSAQWSNPNFTLASWCLGGSISILLEILQTRVYPNTACHPNRQPYNANWPSTQVDYSESSKSLGKTIENTCGSAPVVQPLPPGLSEIVAAWPSLAVSVREAVLLVVRAGRGSRSG